jgi:hypothetical protein
VLADEAAVKHESIKVIVRVRPLMQHEASERQAHSIIEQLDTTTLQVCFDDSLPPPPL